MREHRPNLVLPLAALLLAAALATAPALLAQPAPPPGGMPETGPDDGTRDTARFFFLQRMREELQLTDSQSLKVLDLMRTMDEDRRAHQDTCEAIVHKIRSLQAAADSTDAQFRELVTQLRKEDARFESKLRDTEQKILDALTPRQQAGFLAMKRKLLDRPPRGGGPGQPGRRGGQGRSRPVT